MRDTMPPAGADLSLTPVNPTPPPGVYLGRVNLKETAMQLKIVYHVRHAHGERFGLALPPDADPEIVGRSVGYLYHVSLETGVERPRWADDGGPDEDGRCFRSDREIVPVRSRQWRDRVNTWLKEVGPSLPLVPDWEPGLPSDDWARVALAQADIA